MVSRTDARELKGTISLADALAAYAVATGTRESVSSQPRKLKPPGALLAGVLAALAGLAVLGGVLSYFYRAERAARAEDFYRTGNQLFRDERFAEAIEQYRSALSISHSANHRLALGLALVKAGRMNEAAIYLDQALREDPGSGPANRARAAVDAAEGRTDDALVHFRRAVAGSWPDRSAENRMAAHIQMIQFLARAGRNAQARAELLALAADLPDDPAARKQVGRMLIEFELSREAIAFYSELVRNGPPDAAEYDGLGEAEFQAGNYRRARDAFRNALRIDPSDQVAARRTEICERVLALDPTPRGIGSRERLRRTREILGAIASAWTACAGPAQSWSPAAGEAIANARALLAGKRPPGSISDAADDMLAAAEQLWSERHKACGPPAAQDPVSLVMSKVAAQVR